MTLHDIHVARERIAPYVRRTPLIDSPWLSELAGAEVRLKLESLQVTHSFKARGAVNAAAVHAARVWPGGSAAPLVTASAGNHGRALAYAAERFGIPLVVFTPQNAPRVKLDHIAQHGATLRAEATSYEEAERLAKAYATSQGVTYISPYSHPDVIAGAGTVALEIFDEWPDADVIIAAVGGGGLISGIALAVTLASRPADVIGVEADASPAFSTALRAGVITEVDVRPTIADGLAGNMDPDTITFDLVRAHVGRVHVAPEPAILQAVRDLAVREHVVAEGAGATAVAGLMSGLDVAGRRVAVVVSGSNIDAARLAALL